MFYGFEKRGKKYFCRENIGGRVSGETVFLIRQTHTKTHSHAHIHTLVHTYSHIYTLGHIYNHIHTYKH